MFSRRPIQDSWNVKKFFLSVGFSEWHIIKKEKATSIKTSEKRRSQKLYFIYISKMYIIQNYTS